MARWDLPIPIELGTIAAGDWASSVPDRLTANGRMGVAIGEDVSARPGGQPGRSGWPPAPGRPPG